MLGQHLALGKSFRRCEVDLEWDWCYFQNNGRLAMSTQDNYGSSTSDFSPQKINLALLIK